MPAPHDPLNQLIDLIQRNYNGRAWQGATLRGVLRRVTPKDALTRPGPGRKCIWEHLLHAAYWKYIVRRRLARGPKFPRSPANWPKPSGRDIAAPEADLAAHLEADLALLDLEHDLLIQAARAVRPASLQRPLTKGASVTPALLLSGIASHDVYHTGQIQLIRALIRKPASRK